MAKYKTPEEAYARAEALIAQAKAEEWEKLELRGSRFGDFDALSRLPPGIRDLTALQSLTLHNTQVQDITPLRDLTALQNLDLDNTQVQDITPLRDLTALQILTLDDTQVQDITPLRDLTALRRLTLRNTQVQNIDPLRGLTALQSLTLDNTQVRDIDPLRSLTALQFLDLDDTQVRDIDPLRSLTALQSLYLRNTQVQDIDPLRDLTALQNLTLSHTQVQDLRPLIHITGLAQGRLSFLNIPATDLDPRLKDLSEIEDNDDRTIQTLAYLNTLSDDWPPAPDKRPSPPTPTAEPRPAVSQIRAELEAARPLVRDRAAFALELVQMELAAHRVQPIPNEPDQLEAYQAKTAFLETMLAATTSVAQAIPDDLGAPLSDAEIGTLRDRLQALAQTVHNSIAYLDQHNGTYGALWKVGLISSIGGLLSLFPAIGFAVGATVAAGPIGIQTCRLIIENKRG